MNIKHECDNCGTKYTITYNEELSESDPIHCPFCAEFMFTEEDELEDDDELDL